MNATSYEQQCLLKWARSVLVSAGRHSVAASVLHFSDLQRLDDSSAAVHLVDAVLQRCGHKERVLDSVKGFSKEQIGEVIVQELFVVAGGSEVFGKPLEVVKRENAALFTPYTLWTLVRLALCTAHGMSSFAEIYEHVKSALRVAELSAESDVAHLVVAACERVSQGKWKAASSVATSSASAASGSALSSSTNNLNDLRMAIDYLSDLGLPRWCVDLASAARGQENVFNVFIGMLYTVLSGKIRTVGFGGATSAEERIRQLEEELELTKGADAERDELMAELERTMATAEESMREAQQAVEEKRLAVERETKLKEELEQALGSAEEALEHAAELERAVEESDTKYVALEKELEKLRAESVEERDKAEKEMMGALQTAEECMQELTVAKNELEELRRGMSEANGTVTALQESVKVLSDAKSTLESELASVKEYLGVSKAELEALSNQSSLSQQEAATKLLEATNAVNQMTKELEAARQELLEAQKWRTDMQDQIGLAEKAAIELAEARDALAANARELEATKHELADARVKFDEMHGQMSTAQTNVSEELIQTKEALSTTQQQFRGVTEELNAIIIKCARLEEQLIAAGKDAQELAEARSSLQSALRELDAAKAEQQSAREKFAQVNTQLAALEHRSLHELTAAKNSTSEAIQLLDSAKEEVNALRARCVSLEEKLSTDQGSASELLGETQRALDEAVLALQTAKDEQLVLQQRCDELSAKLASAEQSASTDLSAANESLATVIEELKAMTHRHATAEQKVTELRAELDESEAKREAVVQEMSALRDIVAMQNSHVREAHKQRDVLVKERADAVASLESLKEAVRNTNISSGAGGEDVADVAVVASLEQQLADALKAVSDMESLRNEAERDVGIAMGAAKEAQDSYVTLCNDFDAVESELELVSMHRSQILEELERLRSSMSELLAQDTETKAEFEKVLPLVDELQRQCEQLQKEKVDLEQLVAESHALLAAATTDLEKALTEGAEQDAQLEKLRSELDAAKAGSEVKTRLEQVQLALDQALAAKATAAAEVEKALACVQEGAQENIALQAKLDHLSRRAAIVVPPEEVRTKVMSILDSDMRDIRVERQPAFVLASLVETENVAMCVLDGVYKDCALAAEWSSTLAIQSCRNAFRGEEDWWNFVCCLAWWSLSSPCCMLLRNVVTKQFDRAMLRATLWSRAKMVAALEISSRSSVTVEASQASRLLSQLFGDLQIDVSSAIDIHDLAVTIALAMVEKSQTPHPSVSKAPNFLRASGPVVSVLPVLQTVAEPAPKQAHEVTLRPRASTLPPRRADALVVVAEEKPALVAELEKELETAGDAEAPEEISDARWDEVLAESLSQRASMVVPDESNKVEQQHQQQQQSAFEAILADIAAAAAADTAAASEARKSPPPVAAFDLVSKRFLPKFAEETNFASTRSAVAAVSSSHRPLNAPELSHGNSLHAMAKSYLNTLLENVDDEDLRLDVTRFVFVRMSSLAQQVRLCMLSGSALRLSVPIYKSQEHGKARELVSAKDAQLCATNLKEWLSELSKTMMNAIKAN